MNLFYDFLSCDETLNLAFCRPVFRALNKLPYDFITACIDPVILWGNLWIQTELPAMAKEVRESLAPAFECDPTLLTIEDCAEIYRKSFK